MDWLEKIPKWIQIPLKILLPALCIFSGFLLLISDDLAEKLYLKDFRQQSGFAFGIIFVITLSLIFVYFLYFIIKPLIINIRSWLFRKKLKKEIEGLEDYEKLYIFALYNEPQNSYIFPMNDPTINILHQKRYVFVYQQTTDMSTYFDQLGITYSLQPLVKEIVDEILCDQQKIIDKLKKKIDKEKNGKIKNKLITTKTAQEKLLKQLKSLSLRKFFKGEKQ